MIGLDTNVLVRYVLQDDPRQAAAVNRLLDSLSRDTPAFVPLITLVEVVWVLGDGYRYDRASLAAVILSLLKTESLVVERAMVVERALRAFRAANADFADCVIAQVATEAGCTRTMTFDKAAAKAGVMTLLTG